MTWFTCKCGYEQEDVDIDSACPLCRLIGYWYIDEDIEAKLMATNNPQGKEDM